MMLRPLPVPSSELKKATKTERPEQAVDDRGHAREVPDVDLDEPREPRVARVFLEVDGGREADREGDERHDHRQDHRADDALPDAGLGRVATTAGWSGSRCRDRRRRGCALPRTSTTSTSRTAREKRRLTSSSTWKTVPLTSLRPPVRPARTLAAPTPAEDRDGRHRSAPSSAGARGGRTRRRDVEHEGHEEQQQAHEEQALEGGGVAGDLVAARRQRDHRGGHRAARVERVDRAGLRWRPRRPRRPSSRRSRDWSRGSGPRRCPRWRRGRPP